jgi:hypothetical protein
VIALTVNGDIIGTAMGTGGPVAITIPSQTQGSIMKVTVTRCNCRRYSADVPVQPIGVEEEDANTQAMILKINPTLCTGRVTIAYSIGNRTQAAGISIYDISGRIVRSISLNPMPLTQCVIWTGDDEAGRAVDAGVYFIQLAAGGREVVEKAVLIR